jgi:hypothetical protein
MMTQMDLRLDFSFLAPLLGEELPEVAESARVETLAAFFSLAILDAAYIIEKLC